MRGAGAARWLALMIVATPPARATPPSPPDPPARYGPLVQCLNGYAVMVAADEAVFAWPDGFTLWGERESFAFTIEDRDPYRAQAERVAVDLPGVGTIARLSRRSPQGEVYQLEYRIPGRGGAQDLLARSASFNGTTADLAILARIRPAGPTECGTFATPDFPGADPDALYWAPALTRGPLYRCEGRVGYALLAGEAMRRPWSIRAGHIPSRAVLPDAHLAVHGPYRVPPAFTGPVAAGYRISVEKLDYYGPHLLLSPPAPLLRRQRPRANRGDYEMRIAFAPGGEAAARAFASRLEFVESGDPRCHADPERR
jgi:hypothetical protein